MDDVQDIHPSENVSGPRRGWPRVLWGVVGAAALVAGLLAVAVWLGWKAIGFYPEQVARWLSGGVGQRVSITSIETRWEGLRPRLELRGVTLLDPRPGRTASVRWLASTRSMSSSTLGLRFAAAPSAWLRLTVHGASLMLIHHPGRQSGRSGRFRTDSRMRRAPTPSPGSFSGRLGILVRSGRLLWVDRSGTGATVSYPRGGSVPEERGRTPARLAVRRTIDSPGSGRFDLELELEGDLSRRTGRAKPSSTHEISISQ